LSEEARQSFLAEACIAGWPALCKDSSWPPSKSSKSGTSAVQLIISRSPLLCRLAIQELFRLAATTTLVSDKEALYGKINVFLGGQQIQRTRQLVATLVFYGHTGPDLMLSEVEDVVSLIEMYLNTVYASMEASTQIAIQQNCDTSHMRLH
jgi:hypothetical protein